MKALILTINENILNGLAKNDVVNTLTRMLFSSGVEFFGNTVLPLKKEAVDRALNSLPDDVNTVIVFGEQEIEKNLRVKELIADFFKDDLIPNVFSEETIKDYYKSQNIPLEPQSLEEAKIPRNSKPIENKASFLQGFVTYANGKHIIFLPNDLESVLYIYEHWFTDYMQSKFSKISLTKILKTFGIRKSEALKLLDDLLKNKNQIKVLIYEEDLELTLHIKYSPLTPKEDIIAYTKNVVERLKNFIYAYSDQTIYEIVYELLVKQNIKLAVAESITGGNIVASLIKYNPGISDYLLEGIVCYTNSSKTVRLGVPNVILEKYTAVSAETAYEMADGLLQTSKGCEYVLTTTGYTVGAGENNGLVFIAVGNEDGIHIYKNKLNGNREKIIDLATKTALFYFVKKFTKNNINIEQMFDTY